RQEGELVKLRRARQKMSELFPLTEEIWLDWLKDEIKMASESSEREKVYELFERAVKDYICPEIWLEYAQYSIGGIGQEGGIEKVRSIFERALTAVGLHVTKGTALWEAYREFENAILETAVPSPEQQQMLCSQLEKIHTLFRRQLGIPLLDMEASYAEYEEWSEDPIPETILKNYKKALQQLEKCKPYEEALLGAETPKLAEYQAYIDFEMKAGDPARIQLIYERALAENCLVPDLWARYNQYLDRQLKVKELVLSAHDRAVRNCPWTVGLWIRYLLAMERHRVDHGIISEMFEKALNAGFIQATDYVEIWQAYLDYLRRRVDFTQDSSKELEELRSAFARAVEYLKQEVEERKLNHPIMLRENICMACSYLCWRIGSLQLWFPCCRAHGDTQHCRKALHRAVQCTSDYPEHVCEVLLTLERIEGTLEDWDAAVQKTENRLARVNEQRAKAAEKEAALAKQEEEKAEQRKQARAEKKASKKAKKPRIGDKRKADDDDEGEWGQEEEEQPSKRHKGDGDGVLLEEDMEVETGLFGRSGPEKPDRPANQKEKASTSRKDIPKVLHDSSKDNVTVFVSNLSYNMADPEVKLKELFESCGEVAEIRPVFSNKGTFRGYCYVEFKEEKSALQALGLDRKVVEGRPMFVSPCVDKNKNPDFKVFRYSTTLEKHKLFISGLPFSCTKEELEDVCKAHGNVKDIRLVTNRAGKPKGLAYVEYENEAQASQAVLKMDGLTVKEHVIKVAISNPPLRKLPDKPEAGRASQFAVPRQIYGARGKGRTQLSMMPRALQRQSNPVAKAENGMVQNSPATSSEPPEEPKKMSNADFAKMLLKK
uniref:Spliceosome associated factor 3, U4/U6 recycling protein n=1 Tax=Bubo bubo TaxID=30461 RepID=A0A8C0FLJ7_BUBBB